MGLPVVQYVPANPGPVAEEVVAALLLHTQAERMQCLAGRTASYELTNVKTRDVVSLIGELFQLSPSWHDRHATMRCMPEAVQVGVFTLGAETNEYILRKIRGYLAGGVIGTDIATCLKTNGSVLYCVSDLRRARDVEYMCAIWLGSSPRTAPQAHPQNPFSPSP
jgi:hypothetical protein